MADKPKKKAKKWWEANIEDLPEHGDKKPPGKVPPDVKDHYEGKGKRGGTMKDVEKYFAEKWKQKDLQEKIEKRKKQAAIARAKAKGRKMREK